MYTTHRFNIGDNRKMIPIGDESIDLVVTSPPYPMIEMWDEMFTEQSQMIQKALDDGRGKIAHKWMFNKLEESYREISKKVKEGGFVCINIGDATRKVEGDRFRVYPNRQKTIEFFTNIGYDLLPSIIWHKPQNTKTKFLGSGTMPPNAYVTNEKEHILIFRKGERRNPNRRRESSYFYEERNKWFSDIWEIKGTSQTIDIDNIERTAQYPIEIPYRLINMYSTYGDTVLDPFGGIGTTMIASMASARNSITYELKEKYIEPTYERVKNIKQTTKNINKQRIEEQKFTDIQRTNDVKYRNENYDVGVKTKPEKQLQLYKIDSIDRLKSESGISFKLTHKPYKNKKPIQTTKK